MTDNNNLDDIEEDFSDFDGDEFEGGEEDFAEGDEFVEEEWDSFDQDGEMMADEPVGKKKSSLMFNLIIGLVALGGAGFVGMKFMGGNTAQQPAQQQAAGGMNTPTMPTANGQAPMPAGNNMADGGATAQPAQTKTATTDFTPPPSDPELDFDMPMPFSNQDPAGAGADNAGGVEQAGGTLADNSDPMAAPSNDAVRAPAPAGFDSEPLTPLPGTEMADNSDNADTKDMGGFDLSGDNDSATTDNAMAKPTMSGGNDGDVVAAVESKIDQLFNRLDDIEARLEKTGAGYDDSALKASIARLEKKVNNLSSRVSSGGNTSSRPAVKSAPARSKAAVMHEATSSATPTKSWILTSAQPGKATIKKVGQDDVISIAVGDRVSGLGEVQSIRIVDGKWVVSATGGKIIQ